MSPAPPALPTPAGPGDRRWLPSLLLPFLLRSRETQSWCPEWQPRGSSGTEGTLGSDAGSGVSRWGPSPLSPVSAGGFYPFPRGPKSGPGGPSARRRGGVGGSAFPLLSFRGHRRHRPSDRRCRRAALRARSRAVTEAGLCLTLQHRPAFPHALGPPNSVASLPQGVEVRCAAAR